MSGLDVVILCGGRGTRAHPDTVDIPKPLLPIGDVPILDHVMGLFAAQGHRRFLLAAGYRAELVEERYASPPAGWEVVVVDTGLDTETGERIRRMGPHLRGTTFFATYADGLADIDLTALLAFHRQSGGLATVTTVPLPSQYGTLEIDGDGRVVDFQEKPRLHDHWINAGFFALEPGVFDHWEGEVLEREVMPALGRAGVLFAYRHRGFWKSMDTFKDRQELVAMVDSGEVPWARWQEANAATRR